jgi:hypothetical protein
VEARARRSRSVRLRFTRADLVALTDHPCSVAHHARGIEG